MTKIMPFRALVYNQEKIKDLSAVVCPPYDIISEEAQERFRKRNPHNLIHILLSKDAPGEDKYVRAEEYFREWFRNKILIQEVKPAIYFYSQQYSLKREKRIRLGFIALLRLGENNASVFRHEHTRLEPKEDRMKLLKAVKANLSPIFVIFLDNKRIIQRTYQRAVLGKEPFITVIDDEKIEHKVWRLDSPEVIAAIQSGLVDENMFIADGHHRYEVACAYRDQRTQQQGDKATGEESFNYVEAYFTNTDSRGLTILPAHRLLTLQEKLNTESFIEGLKGYFDVEEVKDKTRFFFLMEIGGRTEHVIGMYKDKKYLLLRLKNIKILDKLISDKPKEYRSLDVSILNHIILEKILRFDASRKEGLAYSQNADECIEAVDTNALCVAFFLNAVKIQQLIAVALSGERMPPKSTYFYPKVLSGLLIHKFE